MPNAGDFGRSTYYERRLGGARTICASFADLRLRPTAEGARPRDRSGAVKYIVSQAANTATFARALLPKIQQRVI